MERKVINNFRDKESKKIYRKGDSYTHNDAERIAFLVDKGFLEKDETVTDENEYPKHTGGGWYELPDGQKIQGKEEALAAMKTGE
jgi:hypothetical protein